MAVKHRKHAVLRKIGVILDLVGDERFGANVHRFLEAGLRVVVAALAFFTRPVAGVLAGDSRAKSHRDTPDDPATLRG